MTIEQIKSMLQRQLSTHQSTLCVLEAVIEYLAEKEAKGTAQVDPNFNVEQVSKQVPAASATPVAPVRTETANAPAPSKAKVRRAAAAQGK